MLLRRSRTFLCLVIASGTLETVHEEAGYVSVDFVLKRFCLRSRRWCQLQCLNPWMPAGFLPFAFCSQQITFGLLFISFPLFFNTWKWSDWCSNHNRRRCGPIVFPRFWRKRSWPYSRTTWARLEPSLCGAFENRLLPSYRFAKLW